MLGAHCSLSQIVDVTNASDAHWTPISVWGGTAWKTFSRVVSDPSGTIIGVQGCDMSLAFVSRLLLNLGSAIPFRNYLYAIEVSDEQIIASTELDLSEFLHYNDTIHDYDRGLTINELSAVSIPIAAYTQHVRTVTNGGTLASYLATLTSKTSTTLKLRGAQEAGTYFVQTAQVVRDNTQWAIVQFVDKSDVLGQLVDSNKKTVGIVVAVAVAGCIGAVVFSFFLSMALHRITRDLALLSNFKFQDVLQRDIDKESGVSRPQYSRISEL